MAVSPLELTPPPPRAARVHKGRSIRQICQIATLQKYNLSYGLLRLKSELKPAKLKF
jgi:hypothetical protein